MSEDRRFWYLATPYRGFAGEPCSFDEAARQAARWAAWLIDIGIEVYSPIAHSHPVAQFVTVAPPEGDFWLQRQVPFMAAAKGMLIAEIPGWETSAGIAWERAWFGDAGKRVIAIPAALYGGDGEAVKTVLE